MIQILFVVFLICVGAAVGLLGNTVLVGIYCVMVFIFHAPILWLRDQFKWVDWSDYILTAVVVFIITGAVLGAILIPCVLMGAPLNYFLIFALVLHATTQAALALRFNGEPVT